ncbi:DUF2399 domain-containing protein [Nonomuraea sp. NPDC049784]|uniref:DUF2399 domain-containing protein n=1 Tax=Nonomuraea sp. NPDC049784 TaxID=3154361 RepID=UPI003409F060
MRPTVPAPAWQRFGADYPPMVCTSGWPDSAAIHLLRALDGVTPHYHGDFAPWDTELAPLMRACGIAVPEELGAERPFDDLAG